MKRNPGEEKINRCINAAEERGLGEERRRKRGPGHDVVNQVKELQIGEEECDQPKKCMCQPSGAVALEPVSAHGRLEMADEINEDHDHDRKNIRGREGRDKQGQRGEERGLEIDERNSLQEIGVEGRGPETANSFLQLRGRQIGTLAKGFAHEDFLPNEKQAEEEHTHGENAEREEEEDADQFAEQIFVTRHRFRENGVNRPLFEVARNQLSGGDNREQRTENAHRA